MWGRRIVRGMPWSRAPLRRGSDKIQAWLTLMAVLVTLLSAPWVARWVASTTYRADVRANAWERAHHRPVAAVLVQDAPGRSHSGGATQLSPVNAPVPVPVNVPVPARWTGSDGTIRSGTVWVAMGTRAGSIVTVWVDERGTVVQPPRRRNPAMNAAVAATLAVSALIAAVSGVRRIIVWRLDRRRLRCWEAQWLIVGPRWSRR